MIAASMTEFELVSLSSKRKSKHLMAETNSENGDLSQQFSHFSPHISDRFRVAGPIGIEHAVRLQPQNFIRFRMRRYNFDAEAMLNQLAQNIKFDATVDAYDEILF